MTAYRNHLQSSDDLITTYAATRAGFVALALEKNRRATPYIAKDGWGNLGATRKRDAQ